MSGVVEFLLARLDEEEEQARALGGEQWFPSEVPGMSMRKRPDDPTKWIVDSGPSLIAHCSVNKGEEVAQFVVSHDPARVLADVAAKRKTMDLCVNALAEVSPGFEILLHVLSEVYSDHPDWREEWRP